MDHFAEDDSAGDDGAEDDDDGGGSGAGDEERNTEEGWRMPHERRAEVLWPCDCGDGGREREGRD